VTISKGPPKKYNWLELALEIHSFHINQLKSNKTQTIRQTAADLNRSLGSVSQSITIGSWYKTHEKQLKRFNSLKEAMNFIRDRNYEQRTSS